MRVAAGVGLFLVTAAAAAFVALSRPAAERPLPVQRMRETAARLWFPPAEPAALSLPDGSMRTVRSLLNTPQQMQFGEYRWNEDGIAPGQIWVRIDLKQQLISVFRGAHEIGTAVILYGTDGKPTPVGTFHVLARAAAYRSRTYDAEMPFMLRLTDDGVAIHASSVRRGSATHGCIGVPEDFARHLFDQVRRGDLVAIMPADGTPAGKKVVAAAS